MSGLLDFFQSASNTAASNVSAPVDGIAWLLRKAGAPVDTPIGGSDWMAQNGLTRPVQQSGASLAGETLGLLAPIVAAAKAPQIAGGLLQSMDNASIPAELNRQAGMALFDTNGLSNRGRDLIQGKADELAARLVDMGFKTDVTHSGSAAGPSSYLKIYDPQTGRYIDNIRLSGHSKGVLNSVGIRNISSDEDIAGVIDSAIKMRSLGPSGAFVRQQQIEKEAQRLIALGVKPKSAYKQAQNISTQAP